MTETRGHTRVEIQNSDSSAVLNQPAYHGERTQMISIVIGDQKCLSQNRLAGAVRNPGKGIGGGIRDQRFHLLLIAADLLDGFFPKLFVAQFVRLWPVAFRPFRRDVLCLAAELQNVPLRDPYVLKHLPRGVRQALDLLPTGSCRKGGDEIVERHVRIGAAQEGKQMVAECLVVVIHFLNALSLRERVATHLTESVPGADRGPRAGTPRGVVDATGSQFTVRSRSLTHDP